MCVLETSKDYLYIATAISAVGLTVFICWAIFYLAQILRQGFKIIKEMRDRLTKVDELFKLLKDKIEHSTNYLFLMAEGVKKLVEVIKDHTGKDGEKKQRKTESKD